MTEVYRWPKGWNDEPMLTIEKGEVFAGRQREDLFSREEPIATVVDGGRMSAAAAAVYLLLM